MELAPQDGPITCIGCSAEPLPTDWIAAWGHYRGSLESVLYALKFGRHDFLAGPLSELLAARFSTLSDSDFDLVAPVPMHRSKLRERGYNQAELLARHFARRTHLAHDRNLLQKTRNNSTQSQLPRKERAANVRSVFTADPRVKGRSVLVIDDICTTGETLRACAVVLLKQGARRVAALTIARA